MELSSNLYLTNLRSSLIMTHTLNLTDFENLTSSLMTSTVAIVTNSENMTSVSSVMSQHIAITRSLDLTNRGFKFGGTSGNSESQTLQTFNKHLSTVIDPVIIAMGIIGNALLALVFLITPLRLRPLSHVLSGLGVIDLLYILSYTLVYISNKGVQIYNIPGACQVLNFILMVTKAIEAWFIFLSHLNRLKAHSRSGSKLQQQKVFTTKFTIFMITVLVVAPLLHILWSMETLKKASATYCVVMREAIYVHLTLRKIEVLASVLLPIVLTVGVDLILVIKLAIYISTKKSNKRDINFQKNLKNLPSTSSNDKPVNLPSLKDDCRGNSQSFGLHGNDENRLANIGGDLSFVLQIAFNLLNETPLRRHYDNEVNNAGHTSEITSLSNLEKFRNVPQNTVSLSSSPLDDSLSLSRALSEDINFFSRKCSQSLSLSGPDNFDQIGPTRSRTTETEHMQYITEKKSSTINLDLDRSKQNLRTSVFMPGSSAINDSKTVNRVRSYRYRLASLVLNSIKKYRLSTGIVSHQHLSHQAYGEVYKETAITDSSNKAFTLSQFPHYDCISQESILPRKRTLSESHSFQSDTAACTVTTVFLGIIFAATFLPSAYTHFVRLFLDNPSSRPSAHAIQQTILFESFIRINAAYKLFLYVMVMPSFRSAVIWLLTHWIPNKITRFSSICLCGLGAKKDDIIYV